MVTLLKIDYIIKTNVIIAVLLKYHTANSLIRENVAAMFVKNKIRLYETSQTSLPHTKQLKSKFRIPPSAT